MKKGYTILQLLAFGCFSLSSTYAQNSDESWEEFHEYIEEESREDYADSSFNNYGWQEEFSVNMKSRSELSMEEEEARNQKAFQEEMGSKFINGFIDYAARTGNTTLNLSNVDWTKVKFTEEYKTGNTFSSNVVEAELRTKFTIFGTPSLGTSPLGEHTIKFEGKPKSFSGNVPEFLDFSTLTSNSANYYEYVIKEETNLRDVFEKNFPQNNNTQIPEREIPLAIIKHDLKEFYRINENKQNDKELLDDMLSDVKKIVANTGIQITRDKLKKLESRLKAKYPLIADCIPYQSNRSSSLEMAGIKKQFIRNLLFEAEGFELPSYIQTCNQYYKFENDFAKLVELEMEYLKNTNPIWPIRTLRTAAFNQITKKGINECEFNGPYSSKYPQQFTYGGNEVKNTVLNVPIIDKYGKVLNTVYAGDVRFYNLTNDGQKNSSLSSNPFYNSIYDGKSHPEARKSPHVAKPTVPHPSKPEYKEAYVYEQKFPVNPASVSISVPTSVVVRKEVLGIKLVRYLKKIQWRRNIRFNSIEIVKTYGATVVRDPNTPIPATYTFNTADGDFGRSKWSLVHHTVHDRGIPFRDLTGEDFDYYVGSDNALSELEGTQTINTCINNSCNQKYDPQAIERYIFKYKKTLPDLPINGGLNAIKMAGQRGTINSYIINDILTFGSQYNNNELNRIIKTLNEIHAITYRSTSFSEDDMFAITARTVAIDLYNRLKVELNYNYPTSIDDWEATLKILINMGRFGFDDHKAREIATLLYNLDDAVPSEFWQIVSTISEWFVYGSTETNVLHINVSQIGQSMGRKIIINPLYTDSYIANFTANRVEHISNALLVYSDNLEYIVNLADILDSNVTIKIKVNKCKKVSLVTHDDKIIAQSEHIGNYLEEQFDNEENAAFIAEQKFYNLAKDIFSEIEDDDGKLLTKENVLKKLDKWRVTDEGTRNSILVLAGAGSVVEASIVDTLKLLETLSTEEGREKLKELLPPDLWDGSDLTCITGDCLINPQALIDWGLKIKAIANNILQEYGQIINSSLEGDAFASGQILAEIALLALPGDEVRFASKIKFIDNISSKATKTVLSIADDASGLIIKKGDDVVAAGDNAVNGLIEELGKLSGNQIDEFGELLEAAALKGQKWDSPEAVSDAIRKSADEGIDGVSVSHKKFPAPADGSDSFVLSNAKQYQKEASGDAALSFDKNGVSFDNIIDGKLIDRKYGHGSSVFNADGSIKNQSRATSIRTQAQSQLDAADGAPVRWEISTELGADGIQELFEDSGFNIEVVYVPQQTIIN